MLFFLFFHGFFHVIASLTLEAQSSQHHNVGTIEFSYLKKRFVQNI